MARALMACANYWTTPFQVGSHHLARGLATAGWMVGFVSDPISPFHWLSAPPKELRARYELYRAGGCWDSRRSVWTYVPGALLTPHNKPLLRSSRVAKDWAGWTYPSLASHLEANGFHDVDLLYCDSPKHLSWFGSITRKTLVYRIADNLQGFGRTTPAAAAQEIELARHADLVVYSARSLEEYVKALHPRRMAHLPNGVHYNHFSEGVHPEPTEYQALPRPIVVYAGHLDAWFDYALFNRVAERLSRTSFVIIGGTRATYTGFVPMANVHHLGTRPFSDLPAYLRHADVGIIPFNVRDHGPLVHNIHPLKLYEYMAAGLPVVASRWRELETIDSPALLCNSADEFIQGIETAAAGPPDSERYRRFARQHDWQGRVSRLVELTAETGVASRRSG